MTPNLRELMRAGCHSRAAEPVYPTVTYTNHATLVTGTRPARHGIYGNTRFSWEQSEFNDWCFDHQLIRAPTLWKNAAAAGLRTAMLRWPVGMGAKVAWEIPEVFPTTPETRKNDPMGWKLTCESILPRFRDEIMTNVPTRPPASHLELDQWVARAAAYLLNAHRPDLTLLHFTALDHEQHSSGVNSREVGAVLSELDECVGMVASTLDLAHDSLLIVGDHGFADIQHRLFIHSLFIEKGWIQASGGRITSWKAICHQNCGQAAVYCRDPEMAPDVLQALHERSAGYYRVLEREELDRLGAFPDALCAIDAELGISFDMEPAAHKWIEPEIPARGEHGYLQSHPEMQGGFVAAGPGFRERPPFEKIEMIDIAPTLAAMMGFALPSAEGKNLIQF